MSGSPRKVQQVYGTAGKYYMAMGVEHLPLTPAAGRPAARILFSPQVKELDVPLKAWKWSGGTVALPGIAVGDLNGDGNLDLVLTGVGEQGAAQIFFGDGAGGFTPGPRLADRAVSPCLGDVDNNGTLDLWLGRAGEDILYLNDGKGNWKQAPVAAAAGKSTGPECLTTCARLVDIDSDGDLDLISLRLAGGSIPAGGQIKPAAGRVWRNNRDGTYLDVAAETGLAPADALPATMLYGDFDNDRDIDLILFPARKPPVAWVNDLAGKYHLLDAKATGLNVQGAVAAISGDPNKDGKPDVLIFTGDEVHLFLNRGNFHFEEDQEFARRFSKLGGTSGQFVDIDDDGDLDLLIADAHRRDGTRGPVLLSMTGLARVSSTRRRSIRATFWQPSTSRATRAARRPISPATAAATSSWPPAAASRCSSRTSPVAATASNSSWSGPGSKTIRRGRTARPSAPASR